MNNNLKGQDFILLEDLTPEQVRYLLDLSAILKQQKKTGVNQWHFRGKNVVALFDWGSTRTRCSFETSAFDLGMGFTYLTNSHVGELETIKDTMRVLSGMYEAIVYRTVKPSEFLRECAKYSDVPVINAFTLDEHPTQMLADALTLEEEWGGRYSCRGRKFAYLGNCGAGTCESYGVLCAYMGMDFYAIHPDAPQFEMTERGRKRLHELYAKIAPNCKFVESSDLDLVRGMDAFTTEYWMLGDDMTEKDPMGYDTWLGQKDHLLPYRLTSELLERNGNPDAVVLHMLPSCHNADHHLGQELLRQAPDEEARELIRSGLEISDELFEKHARTIFREAENRQHTIKAVLAAVLGL